MGSLGFFDTRKAHSIQSYFTNKYDIEQQMDLSIFIEELSIEDNRNIKKLYVIMDLARSK